MKIGANRQPTRACNGPDKRTLLAQFVGDSMDLRLSSMSISRSRRKPPPRPQGVAGWSGFTWTECWAAGGGSVDGELGRWLRGRGLSGSWRQLRW